MAYRDFLDYLAAMVELERLMLAEGEGSHPAPHLVDYLNEIWNRCSEREQEVLRLIRWEVELLRFPD